MKKVLLLLLLPFLLKAEEKKLNIGLCIMATGPYVHFAEEFIASCRKHFFKHHNVTYFVFTDEEMSPADDVVKVFHKKNKWPYDTLKRFHAYEAAKDLYSHCDYMFASDADMLYVADVGEEMLSKRVGTQHPGFVGKRGSYETNPVSTAYVRPREGKTYFAGGFYGGERSEFVKLLQTTIARVNRDLKKDYIAVWHDESHLNRYFIDHPPTKVLNPSYCYPESWKLPYPKKMLALDKNHAELQK